MVLPSLSFLREEGVGSFGIVPVTPFFTFALIVFFGIRNLDTAAMPYSGDTILVFNNDLQSPANPHQFRFQVIKDYWKTKGNVSI